MLKYELIKTQDYLLVTDRLVIKKGDWFYNRVLEQCVKAQGLWSDKTDNLNSSMETFKVLAHLPLNGSPVLDGVDLLPQIEQEDDVDEAEQMFTEEINSIKTPNKSHLEYLESGFMCGYIKAKEKYKYTEDDIYKAIQYGREVHYTNDQPFIQSLSQHKTPVAFECETEPMNIDEIREQGKGFLNSNTNKLKTTCNSQGQTVWVGKYIY